MHQFFRSAAATLALVGFLSVALLAAPASAQEHRQCHNCGRFIRISDTGFGLHRGGTYCCRECLRDEFEGDKSVDEMIDHFAFHGDPYRDHRYITFENGQVLDLEHFWANADIASSEAFSAWQTFVLGWAFENVQWAIETYNGEIYTSGHPFGGNEDLFSNATGIIYGSNHHTQQANNTPFTDYLEAIHGPISHASSDKPGDPRPPQDEYDHDKGK